MNGMRPITIQRRWQNIECPECGAVILTDTEGSMSTDPNDHEDDCPVADTTGDGPMAEHESAYFGPEQRRYEETGR